MTSGWFISWEPCLRGRVSFPLLLNRPLFQAEQQEDASRLMTYYSASCVIMDEDVTVDHGKAVSEGLLSQFGFEKFLSGRTRSAANIMSLTPRPRSRFPSETGRF